MQFSLSKMKNFMEQQLWWARQPFFGVGEFKNTLYNVHLYCLHTVVQSFQGEEQQRAICFLCFFVLSD